MNGDLIRAFTRRRRTRLLLAVAVAVSLVGLAGVAVAQIPSSDGVITACYLRSGGTLRVIDPSTTRCKNTETQLTWNQQGVPGPAGATGAAGVSGYEVVTKDVPLGGGFAFGADSVACPTGKKVLGGGAAFISETGSTVGSGAALIRSSAPRADGSGWVVVYDYEGGVEGISALRISATCATVG